MVGNSYDALDVAFGAALRRLRRAGGLSQERLGLDAGVQRNFISLIETGHNQPTITTISKLAGALEMKASELVAEAERHIKSPAKKTSPLASQGTPFSCG